MQKTFFTIILMLTAVPLCWAQRLPSWMNELPKASNSTIVYVRESGEGKTPSEAMNEALLRVMQSAALRIGRPFDAYEVDIALAKGGDYRAISRQYNIPINKVDEYETRLTDGTIRVWVLCQLATSGSVPPQWEKMRRRGEVNSWVSLVKSTVVPGLGQMGKGYTAEGWFTLGGELLLVGSGVGSYFMAQNQLDVMHDATTAYADWNAARSTYNTLQTVSYIAWGSAAVLYAFNLYRAFTMQPRRASGIAFAPSMLPTGNGTAPTLSFTFKF
ncbi:MAG: hypothetical protein IJU19_08080 [Bacteroidales bacterium]|nr:hypothetical protein [Bacteroidales bacterium]